MRCLAHLSDRRRPKCADWVHANCKKLPTGVVAKLDAIDLALRKAAQRLGRSDHIADVPAIKLSCIDFASFNLNSIDESGLYNVNGTLFFDSIDNESSVFKVHAQIS